MASLREAHRRVSRRTQELEEEDNTLQDIVKGITLPLTEDVKMENADKAASPWGQILNEATGGGIDKIKAHHLKRIAQASADKDEAVFDANAGLRAKTIQAEIEAASIRKTAEQSNNVKQSWSYLKNRTAWGTGVTEDIQNTIYNHLLKNPHELNILMNHADNGNIFKVVREGEEGATLDSGLSVSLPNGKLHISGSSSAKTLNLYRNDLRKEINNKLSTSDFPIKTLQELNTLKPEQLKKMWEDKDFVNTIIQTFRSKSMEPVLMNHQAITEVLKERIEVMNKEAISRNTGLADRYNTNKTLLKRKVTDLQDAIIKKKTRAQISLKKEIAVLTDLINKDGNTINNLKLNTNKENLSLNGRKHSLERCFINFIQNGLTYGKKVYVNIGKTSHRIVVSIDDDGPGIPKEEYRNIFKPFYRLDKSRSLNKSGVGLGLSIAEDIVNSHGGNIQLSESKHKGLQVKVFLPF